MIPFAVADIEYNIFGIPIFEKNIHTKSFQDFNKNLKHSFNDQSTIASFTTLIEKNFVFSSIFMKLFPKNPHNFNLTAYKQ